jgi:hypothetical protein
LKIKFLWFPILLDEFKSHFHEIIFVLSNFFWPFQFRQLGWDRFNISIVFSWLVQKKLIGRFLILSFCFIITQ